MDNFPPGTKVLQAGHNPRNGKLIEIYFVAVEEKYSVILEKQGKWYEKSNQLCPEACGECLPVLEMGLSGDWANNFELDAIRKAEADLWVGEIDMNEKEYDMQYDYVRIFIPQ